MRPLVYVSDGYPRLSQTFTRDEVQALLAQGLPIRVVSTHRPGPMDPKLDPARDPPVDYAPWPLSPRVWVHWLLWLVRRPLRTLQVTWPIVFHRTHPFVPRYHVRTPLHLAWGAWLATRLPQDAHVHAQFSDTAATVAWVATRLRDLTFSFTAHAEWGFPLIRQKLEDASFVVAVSEHEKGRLLALVPNAPESSIVVNRLGVDVSAWMPEPASAAAASPPRLLSVGSLGATKGHDVLVRAMARLRDLGVAARLDIVGGGQLHEELARLVAELRLSDRVALRGAIPHAAVRELVRTCDVFVLACVRTPRGDIDGIPIALMEAMAAGKPTVSTRLSGIPELIEDGVSGRLATPGDERDLARVLAELLAHEPDRRRLAEGARARIAASFDGAKSRARLADIFREELDRPSWARR